MQILAQIKRGKKYRRQYCQVETFAQIYDYYKDMVLKNNSISLINKKNIKNTKKSLLYFLSNVSFFKLTRYKNSEMICSLQRCKDETISVALIGNLYYLFFYLIRAECLRTGIGQSRVLRLLFALWWNTITRLSHKLGDATSECM